MHMNSSARPRSDLPCRRPGSRPDAKNKLPLPSYLARGYTILPTCSAYPKLRSMRFDRYKRPAEQTYDALLQLLMTLKSVPVDERRHMTDGREEDTRDGPRCEATL
jgi:hypothetical protein